MTTKSTQSVNAPYLVNRKFVIPMISCEKCAQKIADHLNELKGISEVSIDIQQRKVVIRYDVMNIIFNDIKSALIEVGYPVSTSWWSKLRYAIYHYQDENIRGNASTGDGACCSNPTNIYAKRHRRD